ncbi:Hypothetical protein D9617_56g096190 [Elsinoe fawcettii]|nr:Hypothetical protein D9617_56g096190 [Elsinoe fawcettii]
MAPYHCYFIQIAVEHYARNEATTYHTPSTVDESRRRTSVPDRSFRHATRRVMDSNVGNPTYCMEVLGTRGPSRRSWENVNPNSPRYQVVTRRKGRKTAGANSTNATPKHDRCADVLYLAQPSKTAKKGKTDEQPGGATDKDSLTDQVYDLKNPIGRLMNQSGQ